MDLSYQLTIHQVSMKNLAIMDRTETKCLHGIQKCPFDGPFHYHFWFWFPIIAMLSDDCW